MSRKSINKVFLKGLIFIIISFLVLSSAYGHEPIFGLGPHTIFKGGVGMKMEIEGKRASGSNEEERGLLLRSDGP